MKWKFVTGKKTECPTLSWSTRIREMIIFLILSCVMKGDLHLLFLKGSLLYCAGQFCSVTQGNLCYFTSQFPYFVRQIYAFSMPFLWFFNIRSIRRERVQAHLIEQGYTIVLMSTQVESRFAPYVVPYMNRSCKRAPREVFVLELHENIHVVRALSIDRHCLSENHICTSSRRISSSQVNILRAIGQTGAIL